jgi:hypothetical protein
MFSPRNEFTYARDFVGNLREEPDPVPVRVTTRLRIESGLTALDVQEHKTRAQSMPQYVPGHGGELPLHPSLQAMGRHYFKW